MSDTPETAPKAPKSQDQPVSGNTGARSVKTPDPGKRGGVRIKIGVKITTVVVVVMTILAVVNVLFIRNKF
ncbi:hypothetical protein MUP29_03930, partial [bacterium]|nr:hypothetical protein [bacterium]